MDVDARAREFVAQQLHYIEGNKLRAGDCEHTNNRHAIAIRAVRAALEAGQADARRYRWLVENRCRITVTSAFNREHGYGKFTTASGTFDTLDAAIDAALGGSDA